MAIPTLALVKTGVAHILVYPKEPIFLDDAYVF